MAKRKLNPLFKPKRSEGHIYRLTPAMRRFLLTVDRRPFDKKSCAVLLDMALVPRRFKPLCSRREFNGS